jgi:hypothetical protein
MTLLIRKPYTSAPVRAWNERAVVSLATLDIAYESSGTVGCSSSTGTYSGRCSPWAKQTPYVVSDDAKMILRTPRRVAASSTL